MDRREKGLLSGIEIGKDSESGVVFTPSRSSLPQSSTVHDVSLSLLIIDFSLRVPLTVESCLLLVLK